MESLTIAQTAPSPFELLGLEGLRTRTSEKWRRYSPDVLPLWIAEMDVPLAEPVVDAVSAALRRGDTGYPCGTVYAEAFAAFAAARWGWHDFDSSLTTQVADVMTGIVELLKIVTEPGDAVVLNCPTYPPYRAFLSHLGRTIVDAPLGDDGRLDFAVLEEAFDRATLGRRSAAFVLCSPVNPTGTVHTAEELERVALLAERVGVTVIADEIHAPLTSRGATFVPYLSVPAARRGFSVISASKGWNLAGLKAALVMAGCERRHDFERIPAEVAHGPSHVGLIAQTAALRDGGAWLDSLLAGLDVNRKLVAKLLRDRMPEVAFHPGEGTYLAWLDCRALGLGDATARFFVNQARVALDDGSGYGPGGAGYVRLNFATSPTIISEAIDRMAAAVRRLGAAG